MFLVIGNEMEITNMATTYRVTADHVHPDYRFQDKEVKAHKDSDGYYATSSGLGCSKTYRTADAAVRSLFADQACTNIRVVIAE
jgi:hypothetical protein